MEAVGECCVEGVEDCGDFVRKWFGCGSGFGVGHFGGLFRMEHRFEMGRRFEMNVTWLGHW